MILREPVIGEMVRFLGYTADGSQPKTLFGKNDFKLNEMLIIEASMKDVAFPGYIAKAYYDPSRTGPVFRDEIVVMTAEIPDAVIATQKLMALPLTKEQVEQIDSASAEAAKRAKEKAGDEAWACMTDDQQLDASAVELAKMMGV